jgi:HK97 family phage portal protein
MPPMLTKLRKMISEAIAPHTVAGWAGASIQTWDNSGIDGSTAWAFDYRAAMEQCNSWVYRCATGNAQKAASVPLRLYARKNGAAGKSLVWNAKGLSAKRVKTLQEGAASAAVRRKSIEMDDEMVEITDHPILTLLSTAPNGWQNGYELLTWIFLCLELAGNAFLYPQIGPAGIPDGLYPMLPQWMLIKPGDPGSNELVKGYAYGAFTARKRVVDFAAAEVMHCRYTSPVNMYYGQGKVEAAWEILGLTRSQRRAYKALFDNGLQPGMIVSNDAIVNDEQAKATEARMNSIFRGVRNAGKLMMMSGNAKAMPVATSPKDISTNESALEEICGVFGYPITFILAADAGKANAESGELTWLKHTIQPMLATVEQWLNQSLLPLFGDELAANCCLAFDSPVDDDVVAEETSVKGLAETGIITTNEARLRLNISPIEGGDMLRYKGQDVNAEPKPAPDAAIKSVIRLRSYP